MTSDIGKSALATLGQEPGGGLAAVKRFNPRNAEPDSGSPTRRRSRWSSVSYSRAPRAARCPTTRARSSGSRSAPKRTRHGASTPRAGDHLRVLQRRASGLGTHWTHAGGRRPMGRQDYRSSRMVARVGRRHASAFRVPRGRERSEEVCHEEPRRTPRRSCMAIMCGCCPDRAGSFRCAAFGAVRLRGSGIEAGAGANRGARGWLSGPGVVCALGRATVAVAPVARRRRRDDNPVI